MEKYIPIKSCQKKLQNMIPLQRDRNKVVYISIHDRIGSLFRPFTWGSKRNGDGGGWGG
jgi:hypothetical protein